MRRTSLALAAALFAAAGTACSKSGGAASSQAADTARAAASAPADTGNAQAAVDMPRSYMFKPDTITIKAGTRVTWTNHDVFTHGIQMSGMSNLTARPGAAVSHVFGQAGTFAYVCPFHPQMMKGVIRVTD